MKTYAAVILVAILGINAKPHKIHHLSQTQRIEIAIQKAFGSHANTAICEAAAESTGQRWHPGAVPTFNPRASSPTDDYGLFQIHHGLREYGSKIYRVLFNIHVAVRMSHRGTNWGPWTGTYGQGLCRGLG